MATKKFILKRHKKIKHELLAKYPCELCEYLGSKKELKQYRKIEHFIVHTCDQCKYTTSNIFTLKQHKERVHKGTRYQCEECSYAANCTFLVFLELQTTVFFLSGQALIFCAASLTSRVIKRMFISDCVTEQLNIIEKSELQKQRKPLTKMSEADMECDMVFAKKWEVGGQNFTREFKIKT